MMNVPNSILYLTKANLWKQGKTIITIIPPAESLKYYHNGDTQMKYSAP